MPVSINISVGNQYPFKFYLSLFAFQGHQSINRAWHASRCGSFTGTFRLPPFMRRTQTRHQPRPSIALAADDIGVLREGNETNEDVLRRQLLEKDRENDKVLE